MVNELTLYTGNDIQLDSAPLLMHQPTIKEIGLLGEERFFQAVRFITQNKNSYNINKNIINNYTNFQIFLEIINIKKQVTINELKNNVTNFLVLLFNKYNVEVKDKEILISQGDNKIKLDDKLFDELVKNIRLMYMMEDKEETVSHDPVTQKIMEKLNKRHEQLAKLKPTKVEDHKSQLVKIVSVVSTGKNISSNEVFNYTYYQLIQDYTRMMSKINYDMVNQVRLAGAKIEEEPTNWMT